jgi:hypothetical protein
MASITRRSTRKRKKKKIPKGVLIVVQGVAAADSYMRRTIQHLSPFLHITYLPITRPTRRVSMGTERSRTDVMVTCI